MSCYITVEAPICSPEILLTKSQEPLILQITYGNGRAFRYELEPNSDNDIIISSDIIQDFGNPAKRSRLRLTTLTNEPKEILYYDCDGVESYSYDIYLQLYDLEVDDYIGNTEILAEICN